RFADVGLDQPVVVHYPQNSNDVNRAVERLPATATEAPDPALRGSDRQRDQEQKRQKTDGDKTALGHILKHSGDIERLVRAEIGEKMQASVEKSEQAEHATKANQF